MSPRARSPSPWAYRPMLLGIPGDNTYSNLAEAQRIFWRQTVLPLVNRTATALTNWLGPTYETNLRLVPDLDAIEALSPEREALWARLEKTTFLTPDEKRAAIGYGPLPPSSKFNPYHDELGRFTTADGEGQGGDGEVEDLLHLVSDTGRPIDLLDEEQKGGHTIEKHVGKSESFLLNRVRTDVYRVGAYTIGLQRAGSFPSLEAANKLVNSTISENTEIVGDVVSGRASTARIDKEFGSSTGYEAYKENDRAQVYMRDTTSVRVYILRDTSSPRGFRVETSFPMRKD